MDSQSKFDIDYDQPATGNLTIPEPQLTAAELLLQPELEPAESILVRDFLENLPFGVQQLLFQLDVDLNQLHQQLSYVLNLVYTTCKEEVIEMRQRRVSTRINHLNNTYFSTSGTCHELSPNTLNLLSPLNNFQLLVLEQLVRYIPFKFYAPALEELSLITTSDFYDCEKYGLDRYAVFLISSPTSWSKLHQKLRFFPSTSKEELKELRSEGNKGQNVDTKSASGQVAAGMGKLAHVMLTEHLPQFEPKLDPFLRAGKTLVNSELSRASKLEEFAFHPEQGMLVDLIPETATLLTDLIINDRIDYWLQDTLNFINDSPEINSAISEKLRESTLQSPSELAMGCCTLFPMLEADAVSFLKKLKRDPSFNDPDCIQPMSDLIYQELHQIIAYHLYQRPNLLKSVAKRLIAISWLANEHELREVARRGETEVYLWDENNEVSIADIIYTCPETGKSKVYELKIDDSFNCIPTDDHLKQLFRIANAAKRTHQVESAHLILATPLGMRSFDFAA